jgi:hypothetical protein
VGGHQHWRVVILWPGAVRPNTRSAIQERDGSFRRIRDQEKTEKTRLVLWATPGGDQLIQLEFNLNPRMEIIPVAD